MASTQDRENLKLDYKKPRLRIIELAAEEILGIGCKTQTGGTNIPAAAPCSSAPCSNIIGS